MDELDEGYDVSACMELLKTAKLSEEDVEKLHSWLAKRQPEQVEDEVEEVPTATATAVEEE